MPRDSDIKVNPQPRYAVLLGRITNPADEEGGATIEYDWHHNHRMYLSAPTARACARSNGGGQYERGQYEREDPRGVVRVIKLDPALAEPDGMTAQEEYEFCERMTDYWANRTIAAMAKAQLGDQKPRAKRTRRAAAK